MKYRVKIEETTTKTFMIEAINPADALAHVKSDGGNLMTMTTVTRTETYPVDDRGYTTTDDRPMRY